MINENNRYKTNRNNGILDLLKKNINVDITKYQIQRIKNLRT